GELVIENTIPPELFLEKITAIDNYGEITTGNVLYGLVQMRLKINKGSVEDSSKNDKSVNEEETETISNMGYLKL
ncbi:MAG: hypothetical protein JXR56_05965, partial [Candidatus Cloacimonetes bacterium]|nr:hypothetical protein [Candidatus Cloacimonadota bacterium]